jgi:16S rRNA (uracil1498-N3)-methyltransferase
MKEVRFFYVPNASISKELPLEEATHALRVLRLTAGDEIMLMDGVGNFYQAEVTMSTSKHCMYEIKEVLPQYPTWRGHLHIAIAPTKMMDRIEWFIEKVTEIGINEISFLDCKFSERRVLKQPRLEKIVVAAVKQSRKAWIPVVNPMIAFNDFIKAEHKGEKFIAHCYDEVPRTYLFDELADLKADESADVTVLIGPEGDFSIDEVKAAIKAGFISISLGNSRLRTETAGLSAAMMMNIARKVDE